MSLSNESLRHRFVRQRADELTPVVWSWVERSHVHANLGLHMEAALEYVTNEMAARKALARLGLLQLAPADIMSSLLVGPDYVALCSVRFFGGDVSRPFLEIDGFACESGCDVAAIRDLKARCLVRYYALRPFALRFLHGTQTPFGRAIASFEGVPDQYVYARPAQELHRAGVSNSKLQMRPAKDASSWYDTYREEYETLLNERPMLRVEIGAENRGDIEDAVASGLCALFYLDRSLCGLVAGRRTTHIGLPCVMVIERMLFRSARGRGLAVRMLAEFSGLEAIGAGEVISGAIAASNVWAIRGAEGAGRERICAYTFLHL